MDVLLSVFLFLILNLSITTVGVQFRPAASGRLDTKLVALVLVLLYILTHQYIMYSGLGSVFPYLIGTAAPLVPFIGSLILFIVRDRTMEEDPSPYRYLPSIALAAVFIVWTYPILSLSVEEKRTLFESETGVIAFRGYFQAMFRGSLGDSPLHMLASPRPVWAIWLLTHLGLAYRATVRFKKMNAENRAEAIWLQRLILAVFLMLSAEVVATLYKAIFDWESVDGAPVVFIAVLGSSLGLMGLNLNILAHRDFSSLVATEPRSERHPALDAQDERPEIVQQVEAWLQDPSRAGAFSESLAVYIQAHLADENTTRTSIAEHFHMSDRNLSRETQRIVGLSPHQLLQTMRMEAALQTMRTTHLTVKEAAFKNGFSSVNALQRMTRSLYDESPLAVVARRNSSDA